MKILSLFDGMSVAQQALKELKIPVEVYYSSEIDSYAIAVTQSNFPNTIQLGTVVGLSLKEPIDLLIGGSPCQDLSIAKKNREGLDGKRSGLFWEYVRILKELKPKYFVLENVASMPKEARDTISEALGVEPVMINASLVSAQNRKRLFWVGKYNGEKYKQVEILQPEDRGILLKDVLEDEVDERWLMDKPRQNNFGTNQTQSWKQEKAKTLLVGGDTPTLFDQHERPRKFTDKEVLRLQSMPDDYFDNAIYKNKPISNTQRYKMCGNAFNKEVIVHILKTLWS